MFDYDLDLKKWRSWAKLQNPLSSSYYFGCTQPNLASQKYQTHHLNNTHTFQEKKRKAIQWKREIEKRKTAASDPLLPTIVMKDRCLCKEFPK